MANPMTPFVNNTNIHNIRRQINRNKTGQPFFATIKDAKAVLTDYDTFPYPRWYKGVPEASIPIVAEREAGFRLRHDNCYTVNRKDELVKYPNNCMQTACSTVYPCYPEYLTKYSDREALDLILNNTCIVQYR